MTSVLCLLRLLENAFGVKGNVTKMSGKLDTPRARTLCLPAAQHNPMSRHAISALENCRLFATCRDQAHALSFNARARHQSRPRRRLQHSRRLD